MLQFEQPALPVRLQAFRALHPRAKPPSREDVLELQVPCLTGLATLSQTEPKVSKGVRLEAMVAALCMGLCMLLWLC